MRNVLVVAVVLLAAGSSHAQWSDPMIVAADSFLLRRPCVAAVDEHNLYAVWFAQGGGARGNSLWGCFYDGAIWGEKIQLSTVSPMIATGPAMAVDPQEYGIWTAYYYGSFPVDVDTWGIYCRFLDSAGTRLPELVCPDTAVTALGLSSNATRVGLLAAVSEGSGTQGYSSVLYTERIGGNWIPRLMIAQGAPASINYFGPNIAPDTGDGFWFSYSRTAVGDSARIIVKHYPDTTTIGRFAGSNAALVCSPSGRLWVVYSGYSESRPVLLSRYHENGAWSEPVTVDTLPLDVAAPSLACDPDGFIWLAYAAGPVTSVRVRIRYNFGQFWSVAETIPGFFAQRSPVIASDGSGRVWVLYEQGIAAQSSIYGVYRLQRPGIAARGEAALRSAALTVTPSVAQRNFVIRSAATNSPGWLTIRDIRGRIVRNIGCRSGNQSELFVWDGRDNGQHPVAPGIYYACLQAGDGLSREKLVLLR